MNNTIKNILILVVVVLVIWGGVKFFEDKTPESTEPIKVGVILPLSGDVASFGESSRNAVEMALSEASENIKSQIEVLYEDDQFNPTETVTAFNKLNSLDNIDVLITFTSATSNAVAGLAEENSIPMIASTAGDSKIVENRVWVTKHWVTPEQLVTTLIPEMTERYNSVVAVWAEEEGVIAIRNSFYDNIGVKEDMILDDYKVGVSENDFRSIITNIKNHNPEAILVRLLPGQTGLFFKQAYELGYNGEFFGFETFEDSNEVELSDNLMIGSWYVNSIDVGDSFVNDYQNKYGSDSIIGAANTYDIMKIILSAIDEFDKGMTKSEKQVFINNKFHNLKNFQGATGTYSSDGENGFTIPAELKIITDDGFEKMN